MYQALFSPPAHESLGTRLAKPLPEINIGSKVALQNHKTKRWDIYGTVTDISPDRRYFIKTQSGRVFVHNRRFLCHHIPPSLHTHNVEISPTPTCNPERRHRSTRTRNKPKQLTEEIGISSFRVEHDPEALVWGGRCRKPMNSELD